MQSTIGRASAPLSQLLWSATELVLPYVLPMAAFAAIVPFIFLFSLGAGWMVWSSVPTGWSERLYLQYGEGMPYAQAMISSLVPDQVYDVSCRLILPYEPANYALGNFMTVLTLATPANRTIATASKPSMVIPPRATWLPFARRPAAHIVALLPDFVPGVSAVLARVQIGRADGWRGLGAGQGRELAVLDAWLVGEVRLRGLRRLIASFPLSSALVSSLVFLSFALSGVFAFALAYAYLHQPPAVREPRFVRPAQAPPLPAPINNAHLRLLTPVSSVGSDEDEYSDAPTPMQERVGVPFDDVPAATPSPGPTQLTHRRARDLSPGSDARASPERLLR